MISQSKVSAQDFLNEVPHRRQLSLANLLAVDLVEIDVHVVEEGAPLYLRDLLHALDHHLTRCNLAVALNILIVGVEVKQETFSI